MNVQNMITQSQYNIDKSRKEINAMKEEFKGFLKAKIFLLEKEVKEKKKERYKKYIKKTLMFLSLIGISALLIGGLLFLS